MRLKASVVSTVFFSLACVVPTYAQEAVTNAVVNAVTDQVGSATTPTAVPATDPAPTPQEGAATATTSDVAPAPEGGATKGGQVSLDFQDADIKNVLKVLSYKSGVNIVSGPEVTGTVTIQLNEVPWQKALEVILSTYGYGYERKSNIITVTTMENLKKRREENQALQDQEPLITRTFPLNFSKASDVLDSLNKMKTGRGSINFDSRTNTLIVRDIEGNLDLMSEVIRKIDTVTPQVLIETKVVEIGLDKTEKLGIDWTVSGSISGASRRNIFPFTDATNKFIPSNTYTDGSGTFTYGTLSASALQAVLNMINTRTDTNILSNPKIVTLDNQPAKINVGKQYPIPQYTYNTEQAKLQVSGWDYKDIGVVFEVTPHVNNENLITLELHPKITDSTTTVHFENTDLPIITVEETTTKVMIQNGQTLVIAGLITNSETHTEHKVPFLGDIPWAGKAFRHKETKKNKKELMIFLTPHIITAGAPSTATAKSPAASVEPNLVADATIVAEAKEGKAGEGVDPAHK